ncbi:MAG TPA: glycosyltransferase [Firmicutes bacterium]|nr:glycosyltransferase [Bacillota bacterium]
MFYLLRPSGGGMRKHLQQLLHYFSRDYGVYLGAPRDHKPAGIASIPEGSFFELPLTGGISPLADLFTFRRLRTLLLTIRPSLLHIHGFKAALIGLPAAHLARIPVLITVHNYPAHRVGSHLSAALHWTGARRVHYIAVSSSLAGELAAWGIPPGKISVIHNGIDPAAFESTADRFAQRRNGGRVVVGTAARLAPQKGLLYFVKAAAVLAPLFPQVRFMIFGEGPGRPSLERLARRLGLGGRLLFCGHSYDLPRRLAGIDIFVLPSLTEGFPLILLEAAATGCAMVASQVGGIPELIENGVQGILVPPADVTALARAIASLIRDPVKAGRLARACRDRVRSRYSLEQMLFRTASLYRQLAGKPRGPLPGAASPAGGDGW